MTGVEARPPYVMAIRASDLFADRAYQREVDPKRVHSMAAAFDPRLLGVIDVSARTDSRFAILDGQHRHALVIEAKGAETPMVCQVYEGLSIEDEAGLFHEINVRRKTLNFWDRWKARRAAGEQLVAEIEEVLAGHGLRVDPAPRDGNIAANVALERIVAEIGDSALLDAVLVILLSAFGRSRDAFQGPILEGLAYVLANYPPDELDRDRLVSQLCKLPVRQIRARAAGKREMHKGREPRLIGAVIVEQYNRGEPRRLEAFLLRVPTHANVTRRRWLERSTAEPVMFLPVEVPACPSEQEGGGLPDPAVPFESDPGICTCTHPARRHEDGDGMCVICSNCPGFRQAVA